MSPSYDKVYLEDTQLELGVFFYVGCTARHDIPDLEDFAQLFAKSKIAKGIEDGVPRYLGGASGIEWYGEFIASLGIEYTYEEMRAQRYYPNDAYWCGSVLAYYQWSRNTSFSSILKPGILTKLFHAYEPLHTMEFIPLEACKFIDRILHVEE